MTTAAANLYQHRAASAPFSAGSKLKKAQKSGGFRTRNTYGVSIKDRVLIDPACGSGNFLTETFLQLRGKVIAAGKAVLDTRANYPGQSLADSYDPDYMPVDLRKAHQELDKVVDRAFGAAKPCRTNDERLKILFNNYEQMTK